MITEFCRICGTQKYIGNACPGAKCAALRLVRVEQHTPAPIQPDPFKDNRIIKQCEAVVDAWLKGQAIQ